MDYRLTAFMSHMSVINLIERGGGGCERGVIHFYTTLQRVYVAPTSSSSSSLFKNTVNTSGIKKLM